MIGQRSGRLIQRSIFFGILHRFLLKLIKLLFLRGKHCFTRQISHQALIPCQPLKTPRPLNAIQCLSHAIELACLQIACSETLPYQQPCLRFPGIAAKLVLPAHFLHLFIEFSVAAAHSSAQAPVGMVTS